MEQRKIVYRSLLLVSLVLAIAGCRTTQTSRSSKPPSTSADSICSQQYEPVCGNDGKTYPNDCVATKQNNTTVAYRGECASATSLTDIERKYLVWLLRQRDIAKLPQVSVKHLKTVTQSCAGCYTLYYDWESPRVVARITVTSGSVSSAIDSLGYDYLEKKQGAPVDFPELSSGASQ